MIDPQPSPAEESAFPDGPAEPVTAPPSAAPPLVLLAADDALACVDELCLPVEASR